MAITQGEIAEEECMKKRTREAYTRYSKAYIEYHGNDPHSAEGIMEWLDHLVGRETDPYCPSSLWPICSHVLKFLRLRHNVKFDENRIHEHVKALAKSYRADKSDAFDVESLLKYVAENIENSDEKIVEKLYILFSYFTAARVSEMTMLKFSDVVGAGDELHITIHREKTDETGIGVVKIAPRLADPRCCPVELYRRYVQHCPKDAIRFFLYYRKGRYVNAPIGKNSFPKFVEKIKTTLKLKGHYTTHSFRVTAATTAAENDATVEELKKVGDWKSIAVCEKYIRESIHMARAVANLLLPDTFRGQNTVTMAPAQQADINPYCGPVFNGCSFIGPVNFVCQAGKSEETTATMQPQAKKMRGRKFANRNDA